jgi:hypothetical protein
MLLDPYDLRRYLAATRQRIENFNSGNLETQTLSTGTLSNDSTVLTERQLPGNNYCGTRVTITPSAEQTTGSPQHTRTYHDKTQ